MGTQQLLLLVLVAVVVIIAVVIAINYFISNKQDTEIDEVINELGNITSSAQIWYRKPMELGGGNGSFTGFSLHAISQPDSTELASFTVVYADKDSLFIEAASLDESNSSAFTVDVGVNPQSESQYHVNKGKAKGIPTAVSTGNGNGNGNAGGNGNGNGGGNGNGNGKGGG
ncbi:MAG TPA: hypothetical protein VLX91_11405 [Candidatus Acidoferrales bacterium]|nr:hypothetical protein [Candidatus Acidoferrales bacterium]